MARRRLRLARRNEDAEPEYPRPREQPRPDRLPVSGLRFRRVSPPTTAEQLDEFFASRGLEPHGDGSYENAEPIAETRRRTKSRGTNKSST